VLLMNSCIEKEPKKPNILFAISDDQSFPHAGAYGTDWVKTPAFDRVAREGILFMNCYTPNAKCAPSRSSIITGRNSWQLEEAGNHICFFPEDYKSFCEVLMEQTDYFVGFTGKGVDPVVAPDRLLAGKRFEGAQLVPPGKGISGKDYATNFKEFLSEKPDNRPFFFWYGAHEPHRRYQYKIGIEKGNKSLEQIKKVPGFWPDDEIVRTDMLDYAFEIEYFDSHLDQMIQLLDEKGELENTLIVVTSDNGMPFPRCKGTEYEYSNHMPLAAMWPKGITNPGRTVDDFISFIDFAPTFLQLAGIQDIVNTGMKPIQGKSLVPIFQSKREGQVIAERNYVLLGQERHDIGRPNDVGYPIRSIIKDNYLFIKNFEPDRWPMCNPETGYLNTDGSPTKTLVLEMRRKGENSHYWKLCFGKRVDEELYNIKDDPECLKNLIEDSDYKTLAINLKKQLLEELISQRDPRVFGNGHIFDEYTYARERSRNFYNRYMNGEIKEMVTGWINASDFETEPIRE
ncbi:sulfatase, partial [Bacteroidota bacterium]